MRWLFTVMAGCCLSAGTLAFGPSALARASRPRQAPVSPVASGATFAPDKAEFRILLKGQMVGTDEFQISSSDNGWSLRDSTTLHVPGGGEIKTSGQLRLAADGSPIHYGWTTQSGKKASGEVDFAKGTAKTAINLGGKAPFAQDFIFPSSRILVLDNNLYGQYAVLAKLYDWKTGGKQEFHVLIPQDMTPGLISAEAAGSSRAGDSKYETLRVNSPDLEIILYLDSAHRLIRLEVPASNVTVERE